MNFFELKKDRLSVNDDQKSTFVEKGLYQIIREFDKDRWLIRTNRPGERPMQLTLVHKQDGEIVTV